MHRIAGQKRCTSIVQRKLTKVDRSDNCGNIYVPRPGRFLALTAAALVYFATMAQLDAYLALVFIYLYEYSYDHVGHSRDEKLFSHWLREYK